MIALEVCIARLAANAAVFKSLLEGVPAEQARWKPAPDKWSMREVINHLADEEREDFRARLDFTLHRPDETWPPIDPEGWAVTRRYNERALDASLERFLAERQTSLSWLGTLQSPDWERAHRHPKGWTIKAGDLLASWLAHDLIHIRQLTRHREYLAEQAAPYKLDYAGRW